MKTAAQMAANWAASQGRATQAYDEGVQSYSGDWAGATVAQESTMLSNLTQSVTQGRWRQGVQATGTGGWKQATQAKKGNYSTGFSAGAQAQATSAQKIHAALQSLVPNLPARGDVEQNLVRANTLARGLHSLRGQLGAR